MNDPDGVTAMLAEFAADHSAPPGRALDVATDAIVDTVAVALAGRDEPAVAILTRTLGDGSGPATSLAGGGRTDPWRAALTNGVAAHALDYDDVDDSVAGHPSAVLVPAVLAAGEASGTPGERVLSGYWRGLEVMRAVAAGLGIGAHYARGWHSTSTLGVVGAAAASSAVFGLPASEARHALGIAVSKAAGSRQNFGSQTKPFHAGAAAADGLLAAQLAAAGLTADAAPLEGRYGFFALYAGDGDRDSPSEVAARVKRSLAASVEPAGLNVKRHPCCYATHAAADATLSLVARGVSAGDVAGVEVSVTPGGLQPLRPSLPVTGLEGKFSMEYVVAAGLLDGALSLTTFSDDAVARPAAVDLMSRVKAVETLHRASKDGPLEFRARVTIVTAAGDTISAECDAPVGHVTRPMSATDLRHKFDDCVRVGRVADGDALYEALVGLRFRESVAGALDAVLR